jgi:hypothetical protein
LKVAVSHPGDKNKGVAQFHPTIEDPFLGTPEDEAPGRVFVRKWLEWRPALFAFLLKFECLDVVFQSEFGQPNFYLDALTLLACKYGARELVAQGLKPKLQIENVIAQGL